MRLAGEDLGNDLKLKLVPGSLGMSTPNTCTIVIIAGI